MEEHKTLAHRILGGGQVYKKLQGNEHNRIKVKIKIELKKNCEIRDFLGKSATPSPPTLKNDNISI